MRLGKTAILFRIKQISLWVARSAGVQEWPYNAAAETPGTLALVSDTIVCLAKTLSGRDSDAML